MKSSVYDCICVGKVGRRGHNSDGSADDFILTMVTQKQQSNSGSDSFGSALEISVTVAMVVVNRLAWHLVLISYLR